MAFGLIGVHEVSKSLNMILRTFQESVWSSQGKISVTLVGFAPANRLRLPQRRGCSTSFSTVNYLLSSSNMCNMQMPLINSLIHWSELTGTMALRTSSTSALSLGLTSSEGLSQIGMNRNRLTAPRWKISLSRSQLYSRINFQVTLCKAQA